MTDFKEADVTGAEITNGEPRLQLGRSNGDGIASGVAIWGPPHYYAVPNPKNADGAPSALFIQEGNRLRVIAGRDNRYSASAGDLLPGDWMFASRGEARQIHKAANDSITSYTVNQKTNLSMMVHVDGKEGVVQVVNGNARVDMTDDSITLAVNGGGSIVINKDGVVINGKQVNIDSGAATIGLLPGGVRPVPVVNAALTGTVVSPVPSASVLIAT